MLGNKELNKKLSAELAHIYTKYHKSCYLESDPLGLVNSNLSAIDFEIVSFISAGLSYGRVEQIRKSLHSLWSCLELFLKGSGGAGLHACLVDKEWKSFSKKILPALGNWKHRFNKADDIKNLLFVLRRVYLKYPSLGFLFTYNDAVSDVERLNTFSFALRSFSKTEEELRSVRWFTCSPQEGSTCKRYMMWLRWMIRADEIDPGLWSLKKVPTKREVSPEVLFVPLDTHLLQWAKEKNILLTSTLNWKSVEKVTDALRAADKKDPVKFDFSLCHRGMLRFREGAT